jgi:hypothetical protein
MERRLSFAELFTPGELETLDRLNTPAAVQTYLDETPYSTDPFYRSPRSVMRDRKAHCADGAFFAAAALQRHGHAPLVTDLMAWNDDDHLLALYKRDGRWGAVGKSNFATLRSREPVYRTLRELVMSYFEFYFNLAGQKTLRRYTTPLDLRTCDDLDWMTRDECIEECVRRMDAKRKVRLVTGPMAAALGRADALSFRAGMVGTNPAGLFQPSAEAVEDHEVAP